MSESIKRYFQIGDKLKKIRLELEMNQTEFSKKLNLPRSTYSNYENNNRVPDEKTLVKISEILEIPITDLLGTSEDFKNDFNTSELGDYVQDFIMMWRNKLNEVFEDKYFTNTDIVRNLLIDVIAKYDARSELNMNPEQNISTLFMVLNDKPVDQHFLYEHLKKNYVKDLKEESKQRLIPYIHEANKVVSQDIELTDYLKEAVLEYYEDWFIEKIPAQFKKYFQAKIDQHEKYKEMDELNKKYLKQGGSETDDFAGYYEDVQDHINKPTK